jgi:hypothetical protein
MLTHWIGLAAVLGGLILPTLAQEVSTVRYSNEVQEVIPEVVDGQLRLIVRGVLLDGCEGETRVETMRSGSAFFVDLYRELDASQPCTRALLPFETVVDGTGLFELDANATLPTYLIVNNRAYYVARAQISPVPSAALIAPRLNELTRGYLPVEAITPIIEADGVLFLRLSGTGRDGCVTPVARALPNWQAPREVVIEAFDLIDPGAMCIQVLTPFEIIIPANAAPDAVDQFRFYGFTLPWDASRSASEQIFRVYELGADALEAEVLAGPPSQVKVIVRGMQSMRCAQPPAPIIGQRVENDLYLKVINVEANANPCAALLVAEPFTSEIVLPTDQLAPGTVRIHASVITLEIVLD